MSVISAQISRWCSAVAHWGRRCLCPPLLKGPGQSERAGAWQAAATGSFVSILGVRPTIISPPRGCGHGSRRWTFTKKIVLTKTDRSENCSVHKCPILPLRPLLSTGLPYYEDFELELPVDYVEDYSLSEGLSTDGKQRQQQQKLQNKKVSHGFSPLPVNGNGEKLIRSTWHASIRSSSLCCFVFFCAKLMLTLLSCDRWPSPADVGGLAEVWSGPQRAQSGAALQASANPAAAAGSRKNRS